MHELLRRCLEKDPKKRRRDIADVRMEIEHVLSGPAQTAAPPVDRRRATVRDSRGSSPRSWPWRWPSPSHGRTSLGPPEPPETRVDISTPETPDPTAFAISPDGRRLVFVAFRNGQTQLYLRSLDADTAQPLSGTEGATPSLLVAGRTFGRVLRGRN